MLAARPPGAPRVGVSGIAPPGRRLLRSLLAAQSRRGVGAGAADTRLWDSLRRRRSTALKEHQVKQARMRGPGPPETPRTPPALPEYEPPWEEAASSETESEIEDLTLGAEVVARLLELFELEQRLSAEERQAVRTADQLGEARERAKVRVCCVFWARRACPRWTTACGCGSPPGLCRGLGPA